MEYVILKSNDSLCRDQPSVIRLIRRVIKHDDYIFAQLDISPSKKNSKRITVELVLIFFQWKSMNSIDLALMANRE